MTPELSAIVVNYKTAPEAIACVRSLQEAFGREGIAGEVVLVDCASGDGERARLESAGADVLVLLPENRGYSGGANAGLARARGAVIVVSNADVVFRPGALTALAAAVRDPKVGAAAPLAEWDEEGRIRLPVESGPGFWRDLGQLTAGRLPRMDAARFARFARRTMSLWQRGGPARHVVGVVLAARRDVFDRVGRFDERFPFEYEETEWEERVQRAGLRLSFVVAARVRHLWARSAAADPEETARRRAASARLYRLRRYGALGRALLERAQGAARAPTARPIGEPRISARPGAALALSPNPSLMPFAGVMLDRDFRLSEELCAGLPPGVLYLRVFDADSGEPLETFAWEKTA
jgi:N-acetylglucosaminyl-diphospho-decaprenol L-rhamnosyltransferase